MRQVDRRVASLAYSDAIELPGAFIVDGWVRVVVEADEVPLGFSVVIPWEDGTASGGSVGPAQCNGASARLVEDRCERARAAGALRLEIVAGPAQGS